MTVTVQPTLATVEQLQIRYPEIVRDLDPQVLQETLEEATRHIETRIGRRVAPFIGHVYQDRLWGIDPSEFGADSNTPLSFAGSLGQSQAQAFGANNLVRHFWVDQFAPLYPELWTYNIQSMQIYRSFGDTQPIQFGGGGILGPDSTDGHCFVPGTRVLTADLRWVPIEILEEGDELIGFDEHRTVEDGRRSYRPSTVEATKSFVLPCLEIEFSDGSSVVCSDDHLWLAKIDGMYQWRRTDELRSEEDTSYPPTWGASVVSKPFTPWEFDESRDAGYLSAAFDGEGSWLTRDRKCSFTQRENAMLGKVTSALEERGYAFTDSLTSKPQPDSFTRSTDIHTVTLTGGRANALRFMGSIRPPRLLPKFSVEHMGNYTSQGVGVKSITPVGDREVIALQTSSRTYLAEGFAAHNCWLRLGTFAPEGSRIQVIYDGGYTVSVPSDLRRACIYQAIKFLIIDIEPQFRKDMDLVEIDSQISLLLGGWVRG
jgi:hypothetical protein